MDLRESLYKELCDIFKDWQSNIPARCGSDLYVILICEHRTVLIIFQKELDTVRNIS